MAPSSFSIHTPVDWVIHQGRKGSLTFPIARLRVQVLLRTGLLAQPFRPEWCWLDTGAPLSVIPFHVHSQGLPWQCFPASSTIWAGQPCDLGQIEIWLTVPNQATTYGPVSLLAKFARSDPPGPRVPVLLGLQFLLAYQAALSLLPPAQQSLLSFP